MIEDVFIVSGDGLFRANMDGRQGRLSSGWEGTGALAMQGERLFAMVRGSLLEVDPWDGRQRGISEEWSEGALLAAGPDGLMVADGNRLFVQDPKGEHRHLSSDYEGIQALAGSGGRFFVLEDRRLMEVSPKSGSGRLVDDEWVGVTGMAVLGDRVYLATHDGEILAVDAESGENELIGRGWPPIQALFTAAGRLCAIARDSLFEVDLEGGQRRVSTEWTDVAAAAGDA